MSDEDGSSSGEYILGYYGKERGKYEVPSMSYADVLQSQRLRLDASEYNEDDKPTLMKIKAPRRNDGKKSSSKKRDDVFTAGHANRKPSSVAVKLKKTLIEKAQAFVMSEECDTFMLDIERSRRDRLPYTRHLYKRDK